MRLRIAAACLLALPTLAHAEPKTLTVDGCVKVEQELHTDGSRQTMTVKCTGEANDPKVREPNKFSGISLGSPFVVNSPACAKADGSFGSC